MKYLFYMCLLILATLSCSTDFEKEEICIDEVCIGGEWQWVESSGTIAGVTITPETEMYTIQLKIDDNLFTYYLNDSLSFDTTYEYVKSDELEQFTTDSLVLKLENGTWFAVFREGNKLVLNEPCVDCWSHVYEKVE